MLIKHWSKNETHYFMKCNFKNKTVYTDVIQLTLKNPWWIPKYEDDFGGVKGLRLYGWLFFYFGRYYAGLIFPAENEDDTENSLVDKNGKKWFVMQKNNIEDFESFIIRIKKAKRKNLNVKYSREYHNGKFNVIANYPNM